MGGSGRASVPGEGAADQSWCLHTICTRSYWEDQCGSVRAGRCTMADQKRSRLVDRAEARDPGGNPRR